MASRGATRHSTTVAEITGVDPRASILRDWLAAVTVDLAVCTLLYAALIWLFVSPELTPSWSDRTPFEGLERMGRSTLLIGVFLTGIKLTLAPQHWVLLISSMRTRRRLRGRGAADLTATLLRSFAIGYAPLFAVIVIAMLASSGGGDLSTLLYTTWLDWDNPLGLLKPTALLSCLVSGPLVARLLDGRRTRPDR